MGNLNLVKEMPKKLGFGCMRLPIRDGKSECIDLEQFKRMADAYLEKGFVYFDTAYPYHNEKSEEAVKKCVVERYDRDKFLLADKMPVWLVKEEKDYQTIFERQLERCGVEYFDFYLLHALDAGRVKELDATNGWAFAKRVKEEGKVRNIGFSFHDSAEVLEDILKNHPEMDFVQLQINYYDWESNNVQSRKCYEVAEKYHMPVIVMEPVKGGTLANVIGEPANLLRSLDDKASFASYAIRFAASLPNVMVVLSGMSNEEQLLDNLSYMEDFKPLSEVEKKTIEQVCEELSKLIRIECTKCRYCVEGCPMHIEIPELFGLYNLAMQFGVTDSMKGNYNWNTSRGGKASTCIKCGKCEQHCPQHLTIRELLETVAETFEK